MQNILVDIFSLPYNLSIFLFWAEFLVLGNHKDRTVVRSPGWLHGLGPLPVLLFCALALGPRDSLVAFDLNAPSTLCPLASYVCSIYAFLSVQKSLLPAANYGKSSGHLKKSPDMGGKFQKSKWSYFWFLVYLWCLILMLSLNFLFLLFILFVSISVLYFEVEYKKKSHKFGVNCVFCTRHILCSEN